VSLVIEALRRVEKTDARAGSIGAAVASYRPVPRPRGSAVPLLLGLLAGGTLVFLFGAPGKSPTRVSAQSDAVSGLSPQTRRLKGAAGLPPPLIMEPVVTSTESRPRSGKGSDAPAASALPVQDRRPAAPLRAAAATPGLVLQAISERDSRPIAIINDQLVKEGDKLGQARVLKIGVDSVEVLLENGQHDTVRFAPPPSSPPEASPSPDPGY
jgi:hypothetical protein